MPDSHQIPTQDRRTGAGGLASGVSPLIADKAKLFKIVNAHCDVPGLVSKRRGLQDLDHTNHYSSLSGLSTSFLPRRAWCFDNHLFVYLEDSTHGAIAAYDLIGSTWQIVYPSGAKLEMDTASRRVTAKAFDRTSIILADGGPKRLSALYGTSGTSQFAYANAIRSAGVPRALDPRCRNALAGGGTDHGFVATPSYNWLTDPAGATTGQAAVGYKVCWVYRDENGILISGAPSGRIVVRNTTGTAYSVRIKVPIPAGLTSRYVMQVYRTNVMPKDGTGAIPDPGSDMFLAGEYQLTNADLANGYALYLDISFDGIMGDDLYTNDAQEGPTQGRFQPPMARTIERFGNCAWYGDVTERQRLTMKVLAVDSSGIGTFPGVTVGDKISAGGITMFASTTANEEVNDYNFAADATVGSGSEVIRCLKTAESFVYKYNIMSNKYNGRFAAYNLTSDNDIVGVIGFEEKAVGGAACFFAADRIESPTQWLPYPGIVFAGTATLWTVNSLATNVAATIATITYPNVGSPTPFAGDKIYIAPQQANHFAGTGDVVFATTRIPGGEYTVLSSGVGTLTFNIAGVGAVGNVTETIDATHKAGFALTFYTATGVATHARTIAPRIKNRVYWSAPGEFECAPIVNYKDFGNADAKVQSIIATVSSIFILKEDGIWRGRGTDGEWQFEQLDPACQVIAPNSPAIVAGDVYAYTSNGVVRISEAGVSKISTEIANLTDTFVRIAQADPTVASWTEGVGHSEDQAYIIAFATGQLGSYSGYVFRYHVPSKKWSQLSYTPNTSASPTQIGGLCTARATRYDAAASSIVYMDRLVVASSVIANSIGIERRTGTYQDYCEFDCGYQTISSYGTNTITLAAPPPTNVSAGDVIWARNATTPNVTYRAPILSIASNVITIATGGAITPLASWPAVGTVQAVFMTKIKTDVSYVATSASDGFSTTHMSDAAVQIGSRGAVTDFTMGFSTDIYSAVSMTTTVGFAAARWADLLSDGDSPDTNTMSLVGFNTLVPQNAVRGATSYIAISHGHAWEPFEIAAFQMSMFGEAKIRRGTGA